MTAISMQIHKLTKPGELRNWLHDCSRESVSFLALDLETTGLTRNDKIISAAITGPGNSIAFFGLELLNELIQTPNGIHYVFHNASFDLKMLSWSGIRLHDSFEYVDTLILSHLLDENGSHSLGDLVLKYYGDNYKEEFWTKYKTAQEAPEEELSQYNAKDVHYTLRLFGMLKSSLNADGVPDTLVRHVHLLQRALLETEISGIAVDIPYLMQKGVELKTRLESLLPKMRESVKDEVETIECEQWCVELDKRKTDKGKNSVPRPSFSFDSSRQLICLLYDNLLLPPQVNDKTKKPSVDFDSLEKIKDLHPIVPMIQEYRELQKIYGTYIEGTLERIVDGRIYPSLNVTGTKTGRISHSNPNIGNMPRGGGLRGMFVPEPGYVFVTADYAALEVYIEAHFTQDPSLLKIVNEGVSKHDLTVEALKEFEIDRDTAKTINFASAYFCSHFKIAKILGVDIPTAKRVYDAYWAKYNGSLELKKKTDAMVDRGEPIINPFGRKRRFEVKKRQVWDGDYRAAYNARIQGTGSDCMSWAFYTADADFRAAGWGRGITTQHDEGIMMVKREYAAMAKEQLVARMVEAGRIANLSVVLKAEPCIMPVRWED